MFCFRRHVPHDDLSSRSPYDRTPSLGTPLRPPCTSGGTTPVVRRGQFRKGSLFPPPGPASDLSDKSGEGLGSKTQSISLSGGVGVFHRECPVCAPSLWEEVFMTVPPRDVLSSTPVSNCLSFEPLGSEEESSGWGRGRTARVSREVFLVTPLHRCTGHGGSRSDTSDPRSRTARPTVESESVLSFRSTDSSVLPLFGLGRVSRPEALPPGPYTTCYHSTSHSSWIVTTAVPCCYWSTLSVSREGLVIYPRLDSPPLLPPFRLESSFRAPRPITYHSDLPVRV